MPQFPHKDFAHRLHQALDYAGFPAGRQRTGAVAEHYDVSRETARKWLVGLALPELERMLELAVQQRVSFEWLATGRGTLEGRGLHVREHPSKYDDAEELRLIGLVRKLPRKRRRALIQLLED
ncbi:DNA-binding protein [Lysobacter sp. LF1]|uniref:DNA-binding protein n=1 Tax=Lysobacter stagni TaxID=3045172 RepID=A0ABT6XHP5_9GAMM|nr:DNA-binding protein [Lysobacter sp. LF1]MDI9239679.1 DNA-binding protein [Lysobacter sp. LF1]